MPLTHPIRFASWRWMCAAALAVALAFVLALAGLTGQGAVSAAPSASAPAQSAPSAPSLASLASTDPAKRVEVIVQMRAGTDAAEGRALVRQADGRITRDLHVINGFAAELRAGDALELADAPGVHAVSLNAGVEPTAVDPAGLATAFNQSVRADRLWIDSKLPSTGKGVGVAVIDTGIAGDLPDFRVSSTDHRSRVVAAVRANPEATSLSDGYGHGTHVAGLIAGNSGSRSAGDPLRGRYSGAAPDADLVSIKVSDDHGNVTVLDVIYGLQFAVDHARDYNIRVVNLSLRSAVAGSYRTDPLDAAVEEAWFKGIVVVTAAGNSGSAAGAVNHAPANDPYVISVGAVDDQGTKAVSDDVLADWSSRGVTQDGVSKPEVVAPGAHMVSNLAPASDFIGIAPGSVRDGEYIQIGGTSMASAVASGVAAQLVAAHPDWTPDQVKSAMVTRTRDLAGGAQEIAADKASNTGGTPAAANRGLTPSDLIDPATGRIDPQRISWSRISWSEVADPLRISWSRISWSCNCAEVEAAAAADPQRISWSRISWSRISWSSSFEK